MRRAASRCAPILRKRSLVRLGGCIDEAGDDEPARVPLDSWPMPGISTSTSECTPMVMANTSSAARRRKETRRTQLQTAGEQPEPGPHQLTGRRSTTASASLVVGVHAGCREHHWSALSITSNAGLPRPSGGMTSSGQPGASELFGRARTGLQATARRRCFGVGGCGIGVGAGLPRPRSTQGTPDCPPPPSRVPRRYRRLWDVRPQSGPDLPTGHRTNSCGPADRVPPKRFTVAVAGELVERCPAGASRPCRPAGRAWFWRRRRLYHLPADPDPTRRSAESWHW